MFISAPGEITSLLTAAEGGDLFARDRLWDAVYAELHGMAERQLASDSLRWEHQPTTLVHEAYFRLVGPEGGREWASRGHFFRAAAIAMRRILVDDARKRGRIKRGGNGHGRAPGRAQNLELGVEVAAPGETEPIDLLSLDEALTKLEAADARKAEIVMFRFFAGLTVDETAEVLDLSPRTIDDEWRLTKAWLHRELSE